MHKRPHRDALGVGFGPVEFHKNREGHQGCMGARRSVSRAAGAENQDP